MNKVLIIGSGFSSHQVSDYDYKLNGWEIVVINNGWMACPDIFDYHMYPNDYIRDREKICKYLPHQKHFVYTQDDLSPYGGQTACGKSATLNISYAVLRRLNPRMIGYLGCDMNYTPTEDGSTSIYGIGFDVKTHKIPDPDKMVNLFGKNDPDYLRTIYTRFSTISQQHNCEVYNFSSDTKTRLPYQQVHPKDIDYESQ